MNGPELELSGTFFYAPLFQIEVPDASGSSLGRGLQDATHGRLSCVFFSLWLLEEVVEK